LINNEFGFIISHESNFSIVSYQENRFNNPKFREMVKEKDLIILELEKLIIDIMDYNKVK
jgi:hypothetical protein